MECALPLRGARFEGTELLQRTAKLIVRAGEFLLQ